MSGHSHWATIRRKKGAADAKRGQVFTRLAREIVIAAREGGGDPGTNYRLQYAIEQARAQNMPKENIERAIKRAIGEGKDGVVFEEITYEGIAPHGTAVLISCVTDNRNRSLSEIRHTLTKGGGSLAAAGSVAWQFTHKAVFTIPAAGNDPDKLFEIGVEAGADDVDITDESIEIVGPVESFKSILDALHAAKINPEEAELQYVPNNPQELNVEDTLQVMRLIENLEDLDDVQNVYSTMSISAEVMAKLEEE